MVTLEQLRQIMTKLPAVQAQTFLARLNQAMERFDINTPARIAAFLAQVAHESTEFRFMRELWGPTPAQQRYEPPSRTATALGNTEPGDGKRYLGRGPIQITGRANYKRYGDLLGVDLVNQPELAETPEVGFATAGLYWQQNGLNDLADRQLFEAITRRINGGLNGLDSRVQYYNIAKQVLGVGPAPAATATVRGRSLSPQSPLLVLPRGKESIDESTPDVLRLPPVSRPAAKKKKKAKSAIKSQKKATKAAQKKKSSNKLRKKQKKATTHNSPPKKR